MIYSELYNFGEKKSTLVVMILKLTEDRDGAEHVAMRIEKPEEAESFAEIFLPEFYCRKSYGFSEQELLEINKYLLHNEAIIWEIARGEMINAASA